MRRFFSLELLDNRYPQLHGLRVFAIISVVQFHVTSIFALEQNFHLDRDWVLSSLAVFFGMDLFFILSGFLIGSILLYSLKTKAPHPIRRFYLRRIFRTFPSFYLILTLLACVYPLTPDQKRHLVYEYFYLTNFLPLARWNVVMFWGWSLALEEQFYLTVPLLFFAIQKLKTDKMRIGLLVALWASALVVRLAIYFHHGKWEEIELYDAIYFRTYTRFDTLITGIFLAFVHDRYKDRITAFLTVPLHRALVAMVPLLCFWALMRPWLFADKHINFFRIFAWGTLTSIMYVGFLTLLLHGDGLIHRALSWPIYRRIATLGYGVYLVHIPICDHVVVPMAHKLDQRHVSLVLVWPISLVVLLALSLAAAYVLHICVEKPSLMIRDRLAA